MAEAHQPDLAPSFGPNAWLVDEMYEQFRRDPSSVSESWQEFFADYRRGDEDGSASGNGSALTPTPAAPPAAAAAATAPAAAPPAAPSAPAAPAQAPPAAAQPAGPTAAREEAEDKPVPLRGAAARIVANMEASLGVPTATSVRQVPAKLLEVNRKILNNHLARTRGGKASFTHLIGFAVVKALQTLPVMNSSFVPDIDGKGTPGVIRHRHVGLGLAVDVEKSDGSRTLLVPCIKQADTLDFHRFLLAYEDLVRKVRANKITPDDFSGTTVSLTNPGTLG